MLTRSDIRPEWSIVLDLPRPPSVNRFIKKLGNRTPQVQMWTAWADHLLYAARAARRGTPRAIVPIRGPYELELTFQRSNQKADLDNMVKPLSDWLQRAGLIENDKYCERLVAEWGRAPLGVRVRLRGWMREERPS